MGRSAVVIGAGVFGLSSAISLAERGFTVTILERDVVDNALAASSDISKVVRAEYGADELLMDLAERAIEKWQTWNRHWIPEGADPLYHQTGILLGSQSQLQTGSYELDTYDLLKKRGREVSRLSNVRIHERYPAWNSEYLAEGVFSRNAGFAESSRVLHVLARVASSMGVQIKERSAATSIARTGDTLRISGADFELTADKVVLAAGAWNGVLWQPLKDCIHPTGHPVFHFKPKNPAKYEASVFPTFLADVSRTGYYGFPLSSTGVVKIGKHGIGVPTDPDGVREVSADQFDKVRHFLSQALPDLADADIVYSRLCLYADSEDSDFWIAEDPDCRGLIVAGGGSGHGFKFAPVVGDLVADCIDGIDSPLLARFRWRPEVRQERGNEASRCFDVV